MTVGELKARLTTLDDALLVVLSKDAKENRFSPLHEMSEHRYRAKSSWSGDIVSARAATPLTVPTLVLWPIS